MRQSSAVSTAVPSPPIRPKGTRKAAAQKVTTQGWWVSHQEGHSSGHRATHSSSPAKGRHSHRGSCAGRPAAVRSVTPGSAAPGRARRPEHRKASLPNLIPPNPILRPRCLGGREGRTRPGGARGSAGRDCPAFRHARFRLPLRGGAGDRTERD